MYVAIDGSQLGRIAVGTGEIDVRQVHYRRLKIMEYSGGWPSSDNDVQSSVSRPGERTQNGQAFPTTDHAEPPNAPGRTRAGPYHGCGRGVAFPDHQHLVLHEPDWRREPARGKVVANERRRAGQQQIHVTPELRFEQPKRLAETLRQQHAVDIEALIHDRGLRGVTPSSADGEH